MNETSEQEQKITSEELWGLLFPACACHLDAERSHFIRRCPGNNLAHAIVCTVEVAEYVRQTCSSERIHIQQINEDGFSYSVVWDATEWSLSDERRRVARAAHFASDVSYLQKKAAELRVDMIADNLSKAKIFPKQKAYDVAVAITSQGEEVYLNKSRQLNEALRGAFQNINVYFPIEEVLRIVDTRNILNIQQENEQIPTEENPQVGEATQAADGAIGSTQCEPASEA